MRRSIFRAVGSTTDRPLRASDIQVVVPNQALDGHVASWYPTSMTLQDLVDRLLTEGPVLLAPVTESIPGGPHKSRALYVTKYERLLDHDQVGSNGMSTGVVYGGPEAGASGFANVHTVFATVQDSVAAPDDPHGDPAKNEIGGIIASMRLGLEGDELPPRATFWGASFSLRGGWRGQEPGGLGAYTAVVQNHFDGPGSRFDHFGYAAVTWPGIGDGDDFWSASGDRYEDTYSVPIGFVVAGQSGTFPDGGAVGFDVGFQSGGWATAWRGDRGSGYEHQRSIIRTGFRSLDWLERGVAIERPHPTAAPTAPSLLIEAEEELPERPLLMRRVVDAAGQRVEDRPVVLADGRLKTSDLVDDDDALCVTTLPAALSRAALPASVATAKRAHANAHVRVRPGSSVPAGGLSFPVGFDNGDLYAITDLELPRLIVPQACISVARPGEYEVTAWTNWPSDASGAVRAMAIRTVEADEGSVKTLANEATSPAVLALSDFEQTVYLATFRVRSDEAGKQICVALAHDADAVQHATVRVLVRPVYLPGGPTLGERPGHRRDTRHRAGP